MADRDQHPSREDEIRRAVFDPVDLQTADLEIDSSIYNGFAAAIMVKGQPRTVALTREYGDAVQLMALIERGRSAIPAPVEEGAEIRGYVFSPSGLDAGRLTASPVREEGGPPCKSCNGSGMDAGSRFNRCPDFSEEAQPLPGAAFLSWIEGQIDEATLDIGAAHQEGGVATEREKARPGILSEVRAEYLALRAQPQAREEAQPGTGLTVHMVSAGGDIFRIKKWENHGLREGSHRLYTTPPAPEAEKMRAAVADIAAERQRQVDFEGWSEAHDDEHDAYQMARAAGCYAFHASRDDDDEDDDDVGMFVSLATRHGWPWDRAWWKPKSRRADLVRAGALIVAEIERLDRQALAALQAKQGAK